MVKDIPVACCHTAFTKDERETYASIWERLSSRRFAITELENGYRFQYPGDAETLRLVYEWVSMERRCCPFLTFGVTARHEEEPITLSLTGDEEAQAFLRTEMQARIDAITGLS
ncbi:hypothetical protein [Cohnella panacarvi]|uniref:hypothetical protein n=1 Tax=Cohnella panacarvi TaxID=400776 RepID=UPI00047DEB9B|nr:hypothetical protein [Cohnella panacarvi]